MRNGQNGFSFITFLHDVSATIVNDDRESHFKLAQGVGRVEEFGEAVHGPHEQRHEQAQHDDDADASQDHEVGQEKPGAVCWDVETHDVGS